MRNQVNSSWMLRVVLSWDGVDDPAFIEEWKGLMHAAPDGNVFFHPSVLKAWTDACRLIYDMQPVYCIAEKDGITIFLPLVIWKRNWKNGFVRMLVPAGYPDFDYHDPVVTGRATAEMIESFWAMILNDLSANGQLRFDEALLCGMHRAGGAHGWREEGDVCPYNDLTRYPDFPAFFGSLKKSMRKDIERQRKRLMEVGRVSFRVFERHESEQALAVLPQFLDLHSQRWPQAFKLQGFHEGLVRGALPEGILHFSEIMLDNRTISCHLGFSYQSRFHYYMPVFLDEFGNYSPGKIHLSFLMEEAYRQGLGIFDFLRGTEGYKKEWANAEDPLYCYQLPVMRLGSRTRQLARELLMRVKKRFFR